MKNVYYPIFCKETGELAGCCNYIDLPTRICAAKETCFNYVQSRLRQYTIYRKNLQFELINEKCFKVAVEVEYYKGVFTFEIDEF